MPPDEAPAAAQPAAPAPTESLSQQMERLGWDRDDKHDAVPNSLGARARAAATAEPAAADTTELAEAEEPEKPAPAAAKKPAATDPNEAKREQLKTLIAELGMEMEDRRVTTAERAAFREERRQAKEALASLERDTMARLDAATKAREEQSAKDAPRFDKLSQFERAIGEGDHEAMAKIAGFENYDKLQEHIIALKSDPAYKRLMAVEEKAARIERETKEREEASEKARAEQEARLTAEQQQQEQARVRNEYMTQLSAQMAKSNDPLVKAMSDDPSFVGAVFRVQQEHWDGEQTLTPEQAIRTAAKGAQNPLMAELKRLHERLAPIFGSAPAVPKPAEAPAKGKPVRTPPVGKPPAPSKAPNDDHEWKKQGARRLTEAAAEEARQKRAG